MAGVGVGGLAVEGVMRAASGRGGATAKLLRHTGTTPAELRRQVTSLNGTTPAVVAVLETAGLPAAFDRVVATSMVWSRELGTG